MPLVGIQTLSYRNSSYCLFIFLKGNLQNFSITWNKISYPYLDLDQALLPTSFKFRANSHVKIVISKTRENSRLKTRYLKWIITEQLLMISIMRIHLQVLFIYLALKNRNLKQTLYIFFLFCFQSFFRSHLTNIYKIKTNFYFMFLN